MQERVIVTDFGDDKAPVWLFPIPFTYRQHFIKRNPLVLSFLPSCLSISIELLRSTSLLSLHS